MGWEYIQRGRRRIRIYKSNNQWQEAERMKRRKKKKIEEEEEEEEGVKLTKCDIVSNFLGNLG